MSYDLKYHSFLTAIERGDYNEVVRMISSGAFRVNEEILYFFEDRGRYIVTPLHWAVRHNHPRLCQYLLNHGAEPYRHQVQEYFPLHEACDKGFDEVVQKFIDAKCDLNYPTSERDTPLHVACMRGNIACVHALLAAGADVNAKNVAGHTPLETALYHGHRDLEALFEAHNRIAIALPTCRVHNRDNRLNEASAETDQSQCASRRYTSTGCKDVRSDPAQKPCPSLSYLQPSTHRVPTSTSLRQSHSFHHQVRKAPAECARSFSQSNKQPGATRVRRQQSGDRPPMPPSGGAYPLSLRPAPRPPWSSWQDLRDGLEQQHVGGAAPDGPSERYRTYPEGGQEGDAIRHLALPNGSSQRLAKGRARYSLYESNSSPEFVVPVTESMEGRTQSYEQLVVKYPPVRCEVVLPPPSPPPPPVSPARERIEQVSQAMWQSFETIAGSLPCQLRYPLAGTFHPLFLRLSPVIGFTEAQFLSVRDASSPPSPRHACARRVVGGEGPVVGSPVDYRLLGPPLDLEPRVTCQGYCTLVFQASVVNKSSPNDHRQDEESILKLTLQVFSTGHDTPDHLSPPTPFAKLLSSLPPHPNVVTALHVFVGPSPHDIGVYLKRLHPPPPSGPDTGMAGPCYVYSPSYNRAEHVFVPAPSLTLGRYFVEQRLIHQQPPFGVCEEEILVTLSQILLGVAHLNRHHVLHCTLSPDSIHYHRRGGKLLAIGDLEGTVSLCDVSSEDSLRTALREVGRGGEGRSGALFIGPEVRAVLRERSCESSSSLSLPGSAPGNDLSLFVSRSDSFAVGRMIYDLFHVGGNLLDWEHMGDSNLPVLGYFSPQFNRILRALVAHNPSDRTPASRGALNCLALLFGPHAGKVQSTEDCNKWIFSESMELYMHPVFTGQSEDVALDAKRKLHFMYLSMADPEMVWEACQFLS